MMFDIHRPLVDELGEIDEDAASELKEELMARFATSPEAQLIIERTGGVGWAEIAMEYSLQYGGVSVATMTRRTLEIVLLELFPEKVPCAPFDAPAVVAELRAFFSFLQREFGLGNAEECLSLLDERTTGEMERRLADAKLFDIAKLLFVLGAAAGYDMVSREGQDAFLRSYSKGSIVLPGPFSSGPFFAGPSPLTRAERNKKKAQRRAQRASRRKNR